MKKLFSGIVGVALTLSLQSFAHSGPATAAPPVPQPQAIYAQHLCPSGFAENDPITIWDENDQQWYEGRITRCLQENGDQVLLITYTAVDGEEYQLSTTVEPAAEETTAEN